MKIFDYTNGEKGKLLGETKVASALSGWLVAKDGSNFKVELADADDNWSWHSSASYVGKDDLVEIKPEDFGVEAICFCTGEIFTLWYPGHPEAESHWEWVVIGTTDWNRKACLEGHLKATKQ